MEVDQPPAQERATPSRRTGGLWAPSVISQEGSHEENWKSDTETGPVWVQSVQRNLLFMRLPRMGAQEPKIKTKHNKET